MRETASEAFLTRNMCDEDTQTMIKFLLWLLLLVVCWPLAILALLLWPIVWLISLPFRLLGIAVDGVFSLLRAIVMLPAACWAARVSALTGTVIGRPRVAAPGTAGRRADRTRRRGASTTKTT